jgi:hypothetical protein
MWLVILATRQLHEVASAGGTVAVDPKLRYYLEDHFLPSDEDMAPDPSTPPVVFRRDLTTGRFEEIARCFSPLIIDKGDAFLCRNEWGDVLRFTIATEELTALYRSPNYVPGQVTAYAWLYPDPPELSNDRVHWSIRLPNDETQRLSRGLRLGPWGPLRYGWRETAEPLTEAIRCTREAPNGIDIVEAPLLRAGCWDEFRRRLPAVDTSTGDLLIDISTFSCCTDESTYAIARFRRTENGSGNLTHEAERFELSHYIDGKETLPLTAPAHDAKRLTDYLRTHLVVPLRAAYQSDLHDKSSTVSAEEWHGVEDLWIRNDAGLEWVQRGHVLQKYRKGVFESEHLLRSAPLPAFCCEALEVDSGASPKDGPCRLPFGINGFWLDETTGAAVVSTVSSQHRDGCDAGPLWQWLP